jgi:hypothetical protein
MGDINRLDATDLLFFKRQLEIIKMKEYNEKNILLQASSLIPIDPDVRGEGIETITYRSYSKVGVAAFFGDYGGSIPRVDVFGEEVSVKPKRYGAAYGFSVFEIKKAARAGENLRSRKANAAFRAMEEKTDNIIWNGAPKRNIQGFLDYPGIQEYSVPEGSGSGTTAENKEWGNKTSSEIYADMRAMVKVPKVNTNEIEVPNTLLLPTEQYELIKDIQFSTGSDLTIMEYFKRNNSEVEVVSVPYLSGVGADSTDRMIAYVKDVDHLTQEMPVPIKQEPPFQEDSFNYVVPLWAEHAGVIVYYPSSVIQADGI